MSTTFEPSSSNNKNNNNELSQPNAEPTVFPTVQQILNTHYPKYATEPHHYNTLIKPNHTTKASLISDAVAKGYIKQEYHPYLLCVLVEPPPHVRLEGSRFLPVVLCIDEGSYDDFSKELVRLLGQDSGTSVEMEMKFTDGSGKVVAGEEGWGDIARVLLMDKAKIAMIRVVFKSAEAV
ncbi:hypothetical protein BDR22DRAFT_853450 [Usnea florida]